MCNSISSALAKEWSVYFLTRQIYAVLSFPVNSSQLKVKQEEWNTLFVDFFVLSLILTSLSHFTCAYRTRPMNLNMEPCMAGPSVCSLSLWLTASFVLWLYLLVSSYKHALTHNQHIVRFIISRSICHSLDYFTLSDFARDLNVPLHFCTYNICHHCHGSLLMALLCVSDSIRSPLYAAEAPGGQTQPVLCLPACPPRTPGPPGSCQSSSGRTHHLLNMALLLFCPQNR